MKNFDINNHKLIFEIVLGSLTVSVIGLIFGYLTALICRSDCKETMFLCGIMSSPHTTSLPLILIEVLYPVLKNFKNNDVTKDMEGNIIVIDAKERGMLYIVLNSIFSNIWRWTVSYYFIQPKEKSPKNLYLKENEYELEEHLLKENFKRADRAINDENIILTKSKANNKKFGIYDILKEIVNTPIIISIISICLCINVNLRMAFIRKNSILSDNLLSVNSMIARCYNFTVIFILGLNFANLSIFGDNKNSKENEAQEELFSKSKIFIISVMKLVIVPLIGCPIIYYFKTIQFLTDDILVFLYFFMLAAPNAINIIIVCSVKRCWLKNLSLIVFVTYLCSTVTLTFAITFFLYILS